MKKPFNPDKIPEELKQYPNWVLHKDKIPYSPKYKGRAKTNDITTCTDYSRALVAYLKGKRRPPFTVDDIYEYDGLGFVVSKETRIIFIDIDHCVKEDGGFDDRARDIIGAFGEKPYIEISQSGTGLHILAYGEIPRSFKNSKNGVEMYSEKRMCALTGDVVFDDCKEIVCNPDAIKYIFDKYKTPEKVAIDRPLNVGRALDLSDAHIIEKAKENPKTGRLFSSLWAGDYSSIYKSHSEADLVLCSLLAFWCDRDSRRIDNIFRSSGLYREKWGRREDYRTRTIETAISGCRTSISEYVNEKQRKEVIELEKCFLSE